MTKSLNVTANIESLSPEGPLVALDEYGNKFQETSSTLQKLSPKTFNLTKCQVSLSVCELVNLIYKTMEEACVSSEDFAEKLFHTVRNLLSMYWHIIPTAHSQTIANIPDHAALIHNNAVYLAHHAFLLGHHYKNRLPISSQTTTITAVDLGYMIRSTGCNVFLKSMLNHKNHLQDLIRKGVEAASLKWEETSVNPLQMSVQNCLKHLTKLKNAWMKILPRSVYCKSIGTLAGSVVEDLVLRVVALEEISTDEAIALINILSLLESNIPNLFSSDDEHVSQAEALKEVRLWEKLKELIIVLGASLQDLNERWLGGKGPLAHNFTSDEVKHLIKAIFQNTERRAQLLAKIK
ncbi:Centromere/kinetochore protein zw10-like protein [Armadillidium nasatum]|uniref:Centromere/kinetochore protein zw10-like protein n=1 Tax=Armadillidium nasatum TaxID=96803 RepID=A0A5N5TF80_9CRUS|nr:Centromere/kinetochore protein zw10-like protein [Armadillidium nasatum]